MSSFSSVEYQKRSQQHYQHHSYGTNTSWMSDFDSIHHHHPNSNHPDHPYYRYQKADNHYRYFPKCTDVPQFDALHNAAAEFHCDEKLHLRHLCNDTARCSGLTAVHVSAWSASNLPSSLLEEVGPSKQKEGIDTNPGTTNADYDEDEDNAGISEQQLLLQRFGNRSKIVLDYSRQQVTGETMELLFDLADAVNFTERREAFRIGERINVTENKPVLHHLLRMPKGYELPSEGQIQGQTNSPSNDPHSSQEAPQSPMETLKAIHQVRDRIKAFSRQIRSKDHSIGLRGVTNKRITDTVVVSSSGGMHLGIQFVHQALAADKRASKAAEGRRLHFLSNIDPVDTFLATKDLDPERTLVVVVSTEVPPSNTHPNNSSNELISNLRNIRGWLYTNLKSNPGGEFIAESTIAEKHIVAVTVANQASSEYLGIPEENIFPIWDWLIGRFSVCSAVGILPLSLQYSYEIVSEFLSGAHDMDEHFFHAPLRDNIPVLLGLLGVWNSTFMGYSTRALIPYAEALRGLSKYVQLVDMESNGKRVAFDGTELPHYAGEISLGEPGGGTSNHPFFQLMHQGRVIPADFIGFMESPRPLESNVFPPMNSHDELMCHFFGQPDSLAYGKELMDLVQEGVPDGLREHMVFSGNRPSSSILMTRLDPFSVGQLVALYEHRTAVQGFLWGINSFDSFGIQLGCTMSSKIRQQLAASRRTGATVQGFNQSTSSLLEVYLAHGHGK